MLLSGAPSRGPNMPEVWVSVVLSVAAISLISLAGAATLAFTSLRQHRVMIILVALAAGTLLGDSVLHLLPEALEAWEPAPPADGGEGHAFPIPLGLLILGGFFLFFLLEVGLRWGHAHGEPEHAPGHDPTRRRIEPFGWLNLIGDAVHNFVDGVLIAVAFIANPATGVATAVAVGFHELPQELGDFGVLVRSGMRPARALMYNLVSALLAFAGAGLVLLVGLPEDHLAAYALPLIAGGFLYIAAADLIPELHHHSGAREATMVFLAMVIGVLSMAALLLFEA